jgi:hypothetical protein
MLPEKKFSCRFLPQNGKWCFAPRGPFATEKHVFMQILAAKWQMVFCP